MKTDCSCRVLLNRFKRMMSKLKLGHFNEGSIPLDQPDEYLSCEWIEGGIVFISNTITACCVGFEGGGRPKLADYTGGDLPIDQILAERRNIVSNNKNGGDSQCKGCSQLVTKAWGEREWLFDKILFNHFTTCNVRCVYCSFVKDKSVDIPLSEVIEILPTVKQMVANNWLAPHTTVYFGGGEPTILPEFDDLIEFLTKHGARFTIFSNGIRFSKAIEKSLQAGRVDTLLLSIDAGSPEVFKALKGVDKCDQVWANAERYINASRDVVWPKIIFHQENIDEAIPFLDRAERAGASHIVFDIDTDYHSLPADVINAAALIKYESIKRNIVPITGEAGIKYRPELKAAEKIDQRVLELQGNIAIK